MKIIYDTETNQFGRLQFQPIETPRISLITELVLPIDKDMYLYAAGDKKFLATKLQCIHMTSTQADVVAANDDAASLRPLFVTSGHHVDALPTNLALDLKFEPEARQNIWLVHHLNDGVTSLATTPEVVTSARDIYQAGVPNTYADCKLCVGRASVPGPDEIAQLGMSAWIQEWIRIWGESPFNADLMRDWHIRTLEFDPDDLTNLKIGENWASVYPLAEFATDEPDILPVLKAVTAAARR